MVDRGERSNFVALLVEHQPRIYAYIRTLVPQRSAAEDVYQETCVVLWEKFDEYDPARPFINWSLGVARYAVLAYHRDQGRSRLRFPQQQLEQLAVEAATDCEGLTDLRAALDHCLGQLPDRSRRLLARRYQPDADVQQIAAEWKRPVQSIYSMLKRLRQQLHECVERTLRRTEAGA